MRTDWKLKAHRAVATALSIAIAIMPWGLAPAARAAAGTTANRPQVLIAVTNSESMDGNTSGAIMTGSGTADPSLVNSSSPTNYTVPSGFVPPLGTGSAPSGQAPYTMTNASGNLADNGPSRLNLAKAAISNVINNYAGTLDFALEDFGTSNLTLYTTWVYYMSPNGSGFQFTNTATAQVVGSGNPFTVNNPCYGYTNSTTSTNVANNCSALDAYYNPGGVTTANSIANDLYMLVGDSSDEPSINDVLYDYPGNDPNIYINDGGTYAANQNLSNYGTAIVPPTSTPYTVFTLSNYNNGQIRVGYNKSLPGGGTVTGPTNAGFVPYSPEVMYVQRGFGYGANQSATGGNMAVGLQTAGSSPTSTSIQAVISAFAPALMPETNSTSTTEIKSAAGQSPIAGLLAQAKTYLTNHKSGSCQQQYVVLITDGLPTEDLSGKLWPPLGSAAAAGYGVTASFNSDGSLGTTNDQAATDTISALTALNTAGIKTYVIGLGAGVDPSVNPTAAKFLTAMAIAGGTNTYYSASSQNAINTALQSIAAQIYSASAISAPIPPVTITSGSLIYQVSTNPTPIAGHVQAYSVSATGQPSSSASWDAGKLMTSANRQSLLMSTNASGNMVTLSNMDSAAFNLTTPTVCVPNTSTIVNYTIDPSYTYTASNGTSCTYSAGRQIGWYLGGFSLQNAAKLLGAPSNPNYLANTSYISYAQSLQSRTPTLLFTNNDGFLYAVNAQTGALEWGWMPRPFVAQLQNFGSFENLQLFNGGLTTTDAQDASGNWATYVVGAAQNGSTYYALKLGTTGGVPMPTGVTWWNSIAGGSSPAELNTTHPVAQAPSIAIIAGSAYATYIVNTTSGTTTTSTLYEQNVATGAVTSGALPFVASGKWFYDQGSNSLWVGDTSGNLWQVNISSYASSDVGSINAIGTAYSNSTGTAASSYVGYTLLNGIPYAWETNASGITAFSIGANGWQPIWAATNTSGYQATIGANGKVTWAATSAIAPLTAGSTISDAPGLGPGGVLGVPVYTPPSDDGSCGNGSGYDDFYNLVDGSFPVGKIHTIQGVAVTQDLYVSPGIAFTPQFAISSSGVPAFVGGQGSITPPSPIVFNKNTVNLPVAWRQH